DGAARRYRDPGRNGEFRQGKAAQCRPRRGRVGRESPRRHGLRRRVTRVHGHRLRTATRDEGRERSLSIARLVIVACCFAASSAHAALFDDNEARARIAEVDRRLAQTQKELEDRIAALESLIKSRGLVDLFNQVEQIRSDIARLRGQQEVLTYELEQAQKRQRDLYVDLDTRL